MGWRSGVDYTNKSVGRIDQAAKDKTAKRERGMATVLSAVSLFDTYMTDKREFNDLSGYAGEQGLEWDKKTKSFKGEIEGQAYNVNRADMSAIRDKTKYGDKTFGKITTRGDKVKDVWGDPTRQKEIWQEGSGDRAKNAYNQKMGAINKLEGTGKYSDPYSTLASDDLDFFDTPQDATTSDNLTLGGNKQDNYVGLTPLDTPQPSLPSKPQSSLPSGRDPIVGSIEANKVATEVSATTDMQDFPNQLGPYNTEEDVIPFKRGNFYGPSDKTPLATNLMGDPGTEAWKANMQSLNETGQRLGGSDAAKLFEGADFWKGNVGGEEFSTIKKWQDDLFNKEDIY